MQVIFNLKLLQIYYKLCNNILPSCFHSYGNAVDRDPCPPLQHVDSVKYMRFTFAVSHKADKDLVIQMCILYACSHRIVKVFYKCIVEVMIKLGRRV